MYVKQRILAPMANEKTVYLHVQRKVLFTFVCAIQKSGRLVERGEVESSQIYVQICTLTDLFYAFLQDGRAEFGRHKYHSYSY